MRYFFTVVVLGAIFASAPARAAGDEKFGIGVVAGVPFGATAKYKVDSRHAVQSHLGFSDGELTWDADFLKNFDDILPRKRPDLRIPVYLGLGLKVKNEEGGFAGIRFVGGVSLYDSKRPYEFFAEVAPVLRFSPREGGAFDGAVGVRRWF